MAPLLEFQDLQKSFGGRQVLRDFTWSLRRDRGFHALLAAPGQGKSTLIRGLLGCVPVGGTCRVLGEIPGRLAGSGRVGYVPQGAVFGRGSVGSWQGALRQAATSWYQGIWDELTMGLMDHQSAARLPAADRARLALALACATRPDLVVLDDPVRTLAPEDQRDFWNKVGRAAARLSATFLVVARDVGPFEELIDRFAIMHGGRLLEDASPAQLLGEVRQLNLRLQATQRAWSTLRRAGILVARTDRLEKTVVVRHYDADLQRELERVTREEIDVRTLTLQQIFEAYIDVTSTGLGDCALRLLREFLRRIDPREMGVRFKVTLAVGIAASILVETGDPWTAGRTLALLTLIGAALAWSQGTDSTRAAAEYRGATLGEHTYVGSFLASLFWVSLIAAAFRFNRGGPWLEYLTAAWLGVSATVLGSSAWNLRRRPEDSGTSLPGLALAVVLALVQAFWTPLPDSVAGGLSILALGLAWILYRRHGSAVLAA